MVTGRFEEQDISIANRFGVIDYIAKPFDPVELIEKVAQALASRSK